MIGQISPALEAALFLVLGPILLALGRYEWRKRREPGETLRALGYTGAERWNLGRRSGGALVLLAMGTLCVVGGLARAVMTLFS